MIARDRNAEALHTMVLNRPVIGKRTRNGPKGAGRTEPVQTAVAAVVGNGEPNGLIAPDGNTFDRGGVWRCRRQLWPAGGDGTVGAIVRKYKKNSCCVQSHWPIHPPPAI